MGAECSKPEGEIKSLSLEERCKKGCNHELCTPDECKHLKKEFTKKKKNKDNEEENYNEEDEKPKPQAKSQSPKPQAKSQSPKPQAKSSKLNEQQKAQLKNIITNINNKIKNCQKNLNSVGSGNNKIRDELSNIVQELEDILTKDEKDILTFPHGEINCDNTYQKFKGQLEQAENVRSNIDSKIANCQKYLGNVKDKQSKSELSAIINNLKELKKKSDLQTLNTHGKFNCDETYRKAKGSQSSTKSKGSQSSTKSEKSKLTKDQKEQVENIKTNIKSKIKNCNAYKDKVNDTNIKKELQTTIDQLQKIHDTKDQSDILRSSHGKFNCDETYRKAKGSQSSTKSKGSQSSDKSKGNLSQTQINERKNIKTNINSKIQNCTKHQSNVNNDKIYNELEKMKQKLIALVKSDDIEKLKTHGQLNCDPIYKMSKSKKEKYLKYKIKYLELKNLLKNNKF
jgi:hypothetical protein